MHGPAIHHGVARYRASDTAEAIRFGVRVGGAAPDGGPASPRYARTPRCGGPVAASVVVAAAIVGRRGGRRWPVNQHHQEAGDGGAGEGNSHHHWALGKTSTPQQRQVPSGGRQRGAGWTVYLVCRAYSGGSRADHSVVFSRGRPCCRTGVPRWRKLGTLACAAGVRIPEKMWDADVAAAPPEGQM